MNSKMSTTWSDLLRVCFFSEGTNAQVLRQERAIWSSTTQAQGEHMSRGHVCADALMTFDMLKGSSRCRSLM